MDLARRDPLDRAYHRDIALLDRRVPAIHGRAQLPRRRLSKVRGVRLCWQ